MKLAGFRLLKFSKFGRSSDEDVDDFIGRSSTAMSVDDMDDLTRMALSSPQVSYTGTVAIPRAALSGGGHLRGEIIVDVPPRRHYNFGQISVDDESKRERKFRVQGHPWIHSIPLIVLFCFFCLWIRSSQVEFSPLSHSTQR